MRAFFLLLTWVILLLEDADALLEDEEDVVVAGLFLLVGIKAGGAEERLVGLTAVTGLPELTASVVRPDKRAAE